MTAESESERDAAASNDIALVRYHATWTRTLARLQRAHPARWSVPGWSPEEVRDALTLQLIEVVRGDRAEHGLFERDGVPWAIVVMRTRLAELRRAHRLAETPTELDGSLLPSREPTPEEQCLEAESEACFALARGHAEDRLSRPQRRWYAAMRLAANGGAFFRASDDLNLAEAARVLGKNRSSAQRAYRELRDTFTSELARVRR